MPALIHLRPFVEVEEEEGLDGEGKARMRPPWSYCVFQGAKIVIVRDLKVDAGRVL